MKIIQKNFIATMIAAVFDTAFDRLMVHEGGYVNHPNDPGGATKWGVTESVARKYGYKGNMVNLPKSTAHAIAKKLYWDAIQGDQLETVVAYQVMDAAYNHGNRNAIRMLQRAVGTNDDGIIGRLTLGAVNKMDKNDVILRFNAERLEFYARLRNFKTFGRGWIRRVAGNLRWAAKDN